MARAHLRGLGRTRARRLGDLSPIDAGLIQTGIQTAGQVASVALAPTPTTSIMYPGGAVVTASGGAQLPATAALASPFSPLLLLGGLAILAVVLLKN